LFKFGVASGPYCFAVGFVLIIKLEFDHYCRVNTFRAENNIFFKNSANVIYKNQVKTELGFLILLFILE
jgi:hypothetical protein